MAPDADSEKKTLPAQAGRALAAINTIASDSSEVFSSSASVASAALADPAASDISAARHPAKPFDDPDDQRFMRLAIAQAHAAAAAGEVPVGAVVVHRGQVIAVGSNAPIAGHDPTAHAEIVALRAAAQVLGNYRLDGCTLYVTLEPCTMCSGAMLHARLAAVVFGAADARTGAAGSVLDVFDEPRLNHQTAVRRGVLAAECAALLQAFFRHQRHRQQVAAVPLRDDALRTPETAFGSLSPRAWPACYRANLPALDRLRMHWIDTAAGQASNGPTEGQAGARGVPVWLCLHGATLPSWRFDAFAAEVAGQGGRALVPDLVGFGRSDKPKRDDFHDPARHRAMLAEWLAALHTGPLILVTHAGDEAIAQALYPALASQVVAWWRLPMPLAEPHDAAPFPDRGHRAGPLAVGRWPTDAAGASLLSGSTHLPALSASEPVALQIRRAMEYFRA